MLLFILYISILTIYCAYYYQTHYILYHQKIAPTMQINNNFTPLMVYMKRKTTKVCYTKGLSL